MNKQERLRIQTRLDLLERSKQGLGIHPLALTAAFLTTGLIHRAPGLTCVALITMFVVVLSRVLVLGELRGSPGHKPNQNPNLVAHYDRVHVILLQACSSVWGVVFGILLFRFGYWDPDVLTFALYHCALAFGAISIFVHSRKHMVIAQICYFGPSVIAHLLHPGHRPLTYAVILFLFTLYTVAKGKRLNEIYLQQISDQFDLSVAAYQDCLTGLPNRLYMSELLERSVEESAERGRHLALLYIDLDGFKKINDTYSHRVGDLLLREAASRMHSCLRENDVVARIGGDEFTVLLPDCASEQDALQVANRILLGAREPVLFEEAQLHYSASIGVSLFPTSASSLDHLVRTADEAMYAAKGAGKDRICLALSGETRQVLLPELLPA